MQHHHVTAENIDIVRDQIASGDQREEVEPGCETWGILYQPGSQRGQITVWPREGRAAIALGGPSVWGDWDPDTRTIITDYVDTNGRPIVYDETGAFVSADCD